MQFYTVSLTLTTTTATTTTTTTTVFYSHYGHSTVKETPVVHSVLFIPASVALYFKTYEILVSRSDFSKI